MAGKVQIAWPDDDRLIELAEEYGSVYAVAQVLEVSRPGLDHHVKKDSARRAQWDAAVEWYNATKRNDARDGDVTREERLEHEVQELRARLAKDRKAEVAEERLIHAVEHALANVKPAGGPRPHTQPPAESKRARHRQVLILSDFHGGEVVDPDHVNGLNAYSWEIQLARVDELIAGTLSHGRYAPALTGLDVLFVGDMCSGANHEELAVTNEYPLAEQGVRMGYLQGQILERLAQHYANVRALVVPGNHPRLPKKPAAKNVHDNMDWVAGLIAKEHVRNLSNVSVTVPRGAATLWEVAGRTLYVWHGDGVRSTMPGVPWGGVMRRVNQLASQHHQRIDHFVLGHFHQANVVQGGRILMNGSLKGVDEWCLKTFGGGDPPTQLLVTFDEKKERVTTFDVVTPTAGIPA